ncbi:polysaccharide biosynthesis domain containing protein 1, partial [Entophlyctis luteolus]
MKIWSVKALHHAETFFKLISSIDASKLRLTKIDDEIYVSFKATFPEINVTSLREYDEFKSPEAKEKWRNWIKQLRGAIWLCDSHVPDFNYGTLLRTRSGEDYGPDNSFFGDRSFAFEVLTAKMRDSDAGAVSGCGD